MKKRRRDVDDDGIEEQSHVDVNRVGNESDQDSSFSASERPDGCETAPSRRCGAYALYLNPGSRSTLSLYSFIALTQDKQLRALDAHQFPFDSKTGEGPRESSAVHFLFRGIGTCVFKRLLELGCDVNEQDGFGFTVMHHLFLNPLCYSDRCGNWPNIDAFVRVLAKFGARVDIVSKAGETPLHSFARAFRSPHRMCDHRSELMNSIRKRFRCSVLHENVVGETALALYKSNSWPGIHFQDLKILEDMTREELTRIAEMVDGVLIPVLVTIVVNYVF